MGRDLKYEKVAKLAKQVQQDRLELGEIPTMQRALVIGYLEAEKIAENNQHQKILDNLDSMSQSELLDIASTFPSIKYESRMSKPKLRIAIKQAIHG